MDNLPIEIVGKILSHVAVARDVVLASATCRKWREAFRDHLRVLSFESGDWEGFYDLSATEIEMLITRTIFQTRGLQSLSIVLADVFSPSVVMSWLLYTRESLLELKYEVNTEPELDIVEICANQKLEKLILSNHAIEPKDSNYHRFTSLRSLTLQNVHISELDLNLLLKACPKLEFLELFELDFDGSGFDVDGISSGELILESDSIEILHIRNMNFKFLKVIGKYSLKKIAIGFATVQRLQVSDSVVNLETIVISNSTILLVEFYRLILRSSKLRTLRLWDAAFADSSAPVDIEMVAMCCPQLTHLFVGCDLVEGVQLPYRLRGSACFGNVVYLKVGWWGNLNEEFLDLVFGLIERCPKLKKLDIDWMVARLKAGEYHQVKARFSTAMYQFMRKHADVPNRWKFGISNPTLLSDSCLFCTAEVSHL